MANKMLNFILLFAIVASINCAVISQYPSSLDWRTQGIIFDPPTQGQCDSSAIISVLDLISAVYKLGGGKLEKLSRQQLYDCGPKDWCPCGTVGNISEVLSQVIEQKDNQIDTEAAYPYTGTCDHICRIKPSPYALGAFVWTSQGTEDQLLYSIQNEPLVMEINAGQSSFLDYTGGIYDDPNCTGDNLNQAVLLVGYGIDQKTQQQYWIIRNSWGTSWGENGYMRIVKGKGRCGIGKSFAYL